MLSDKNQDILLVAKQIWQTPKIEILEINSVGNGSFGEPDGGGRHLPLG